MDREREERVDRLMEVTRDSMIGDLLIQGSEHMRAVGDRGMTLVYDKEADSGERSITLLGSRVSGIETRM